MSINRNVHKLVRYSKFFIQGLCFLCNLQCLVFLLYCTARTRVGVMQHTYMSSPVQVPEIVGPQGTNDVIAWASIFGSSANPPCFTDFIYQWQYALYPSSLPGFPFPPFPHSLFCPGTGVLFLHPSSYNSLCVCPLPVAHGVVVSLFSYNFTCISC